MANEKHLARLMQGVDVWNRWRQEFDDIRPGLRGADLSEAHLVGANLSEADLRGANLGKANLFDANLFSADLRGAILGGASILSAELSETDMSQANLFRADIRGATLSSADLSGASLREAKLISTNLRGAKLISADLRGADLSRADLSKADLSGADLSRATLVETNLTEATLTNCHIYGIAAWNVELQGARQNDLIITPADEPTITVDHLEVAQFLYLLLNNSKIREVIDTIAKKAVLILGRFTPERKAILEALRSALRTEGYLPILFDFEKPSSRNLTETVRTLAHLSRFIIADLTDPSSIPHELSAIVPTLRVPVRPVLLEGKQEYAMFLDLLKAYHWVLPIHWYKDQAELLDGLKTAVIEPAEQKVQELEKR